MFFGNQAEAHDGEAMGGVSIVRGRDTRAGINAAFKNCKSRILKVQTDVWEDAALARLDMLRALKAGGTL